MLWMFIFHLESFLSCKIFCNIHEKKYCFRKSVFNIQHRIFTECIFRKKNALKDKIEKSKEVYRTIVKKRVVSGRFCIAKSKNLLVSNNLFVAMIK